MKKRILSFCLTLVLLTSCLGICGGQKFVYGLEKTSGNSISCGLGMTTVLKEDGTVWIWGHNDYSDFGLKSNSKPTLVEGLTDVVAVSVGWYRAIALKKDGTVWSWGKDLEEADGSVEPVKIDGLSNIISISTNLAGSLALKNDGTVWSWDTRISGDGTKEFRITPIMIPGLKDVVSISMGMNDAFVVKKDGSVWGWGDNYYGKLGNGTTMNQYSPVLVKGLSDIKSVAAGETHALALKKDGTVWGWGYNLSGELALDTFDYSNMPNQVKGIKDVVAISAGNRYSVALCEDQTLWVWGDNFLGTLGIGSSYDELSESTIPVKVSLLKDVVAITAGEDHIMALQQDGTLWNWGDLDGSMEGVSLPVKASLNLGEQEFIISSDTAASVATSYQAVPTKSKVLVNGSEVGFDAYNISGNNYFKLRDIAMAVTGTGTQFEVTWDDEKNAINLLTKKAYTAVGGELSQNSAGLAQNALQSTSKVYIDDNAVNLTAYNLSGSNYFKLRDLGTALGFSVSWDEVEKAIKIETL